MHDLRKPILVNKYEVVTNESLNRIAAKQGVMVYVKVRIADTHHIQSSGLSDEQFSYALSAHFDFVVYDGNRLPVFAVEFDEPHHFSDLETIRKDRLKNSICNHFGFPILRIDKAYLERVGGFATLLDWLIEMWFLEQEFAKAQQRGEISEDEDFYTFSILEFGIIENGRFRPIEMEEYARLKLEGKDVTFRSYDPFLQADAQFHVFYRHGIIKEMIPETFQEFSWKHEYASAVSYVHASDGSILFGEASCRVSNFVTGGFELAFRLANMECLAKIKLYRKGLTKGISEHAIDILKSQVERRIRQLDRL